MESTPLVSIICLSYNHENYIEQALNSIINQTYSNIEIIYLDNHSIDQSFEVGCKLLAKSNIKYTSKQFDENIGIPKALNYTIKHLVHGDYISMISMDDWLEAENIEEKMSYLTQFPGTGMVYSYGYYYYEDIDKSELIPTHFFKEGMIFNDLLKRNFIYMMGTVIKKEVYDTIGLYNEAISIEDWEFALRTAEKYPIGLIKKPLFNYRRHSTNYSNGSKKYYQECFKILAPYKKHISYKIGYQWINNLYISYIHDSKPNINSLIYLIKKIQLNKLYIKKLLKYFVILCINTIKKDEFKANN